ncbi:sclerostin domain-containing protein 1a [Dunckerocampus dactyliophorus]|uniref:sclerostin domain-containing protein 1a n=1 Tax=Dunckerocampus dactyliophorus TaxID=161453 RepID=UPI0024070951|nr:sclerostin domain-containing protein 1a [Dunckerocampus dactyliophorus]
MHQESCHSLVLLCILLRSSGHALKNDATEVLSPHASAPVAGAQHSNVSLNRARSGGRALAAAGAEHDRSEQSQIGCRELRSTKYISDGHCTSINPIKELVCAGECLPAQMLQNWIGGPYSRKFWSRRGAGVSSTGNQDWRCVNDKTRTQRIRLQCQDGSTRTYKITVVTSCKCKRYSRQHNESGHKFEPMVLSPPQLLHKHKAKSKKQLGKKRLSENWHQTEP